MEDDIDAHSELHLPDHDSHSPNSTGPFRTECDSYRVYRQYAHGKPSITPDHFYSLSEVLDSPYLSLDPSSPSSILGLTFQKVQKTVEAFFSQIRSYNLTSWFEIFEIYLSHTFYYINRHKKMQLFLF